MSNYLNTDYMTVTLHDSILSLCWKTTTQHMNDELFKNEAWQFASIVQQTQSKKILVDMRAFGYILSDAIIAWRHKHIISVYNEVGVEKFAFISEHPTPSQANPENTFLTATFATRQEAEARLLD